MAQSLSTDFETKLKTEEISSNSLQKPLLTDLPDEVLQHITYFCSTNEVLSSVQRVSKRFASLASEPLLWRHHCKAEFKYWDSKHSIRQKYLGNVKDVDWKVLYSYRRRVDSQTTQLLDSILEGQVDRISKFNSIAEFGYDAKDTLLRHCHTHEDAADVLARR
jgi:F-box protein 21